MENAFNKIAGYKEEKKVLIDLCNIIKRREELKRAGGKLPRGLCLIGPCGVGKTKMARSFIRESKCQCVEINSNEISVRMGFNDYLEEKFREAMGKAPCIIFIDEVDKFAGSDFDMFPGSSSRSSVLLDTVNKYADVEGLFMLMVANTVQHLDKALIRSGRIDKIIKVDYPSESERMEIIRYYASNKAFDESVSFANLAKITTGFSGADLESLLNDALIKSLNSFHSNITNEDIMSVFNDKLFNCMGKDSGLSLDNQRLVAYHEAGHVAMSLLNGGSSIYCATIIPRGNTTGHVNEVNDEKKLTTIKDIKKHVKVSLAGLVSEQLFLKHRSAGSISDIRHAQKCVSDLVRIHGICGFDKLSFVDDYHESSDSEHKRQAIEAAENKLFNSLYKSVERALLKHKPLIERLCASLINKKIIAKDEIENIYNEYRKEQSIKTKDESKHQN